MPTVRDLKYSLKLYKKKGHCPSYYDMNKKQLMDNVKKLNVDIKKAPKPKSKLRRSTRLKK